MRDEASNGPGWMRAIALAILVGTGPIAANARGAGQGPPGQAREGIHWPGEGGKRIKVAIGLYLVDFARINLREESFDMAGYLDASWTDPDLALKPGEARGRVRRFRPGQVWAPALEFVNAAEQVNTEREGDLYVTDEGRVSQRIRFSHKFQSPMNLKRFPFDSQTLTVVVSPFDPFAKDLDLVADQRKVGVLEGASVTDWDILATRARLDDDPSLTEQQQFLFMIDVRRRSTFYIWRILLPMTLLVCASWIVFWFEPVNLQPQVSTGLAILLSLVTFTYAIDFSLPKVAYLTFIDRYTLTSFAFVLLAILDVAIIHRFVQGKDLEGAGRLQARSRVAFPVAFLGAVAMVAALSFR